MTNELKTPPAQDIDDYFASVPAEDRAALEDLRVIIRTAAPEAEEGISYRIPVFNWNGPLVFFAAFKNHLGLYVVSRKILEQFKTDLKPFKVSGTTIHFSAAHPLPASLVTAIIRARIAENGIRTSQDGQNRHQYVAFLRGINVGGNTPIKMQDLTSVFQARGFENVQTVLTSGNVVFESDLINISALTGEITDLLQKAFSQEIPVILRTMNDLVNIQTSDPFKEEVITPDTRFYITFFAEKNKTHVIAVPGPLTQKGIRIIQVTGAEVFSAVDLSLGKGTPELMKLLEHTCGSDITTRNWNTIQKVIKKAKRNIISPVTN